MNQEMTERIAETKELVITAEWREKILACQESGKPVTAWCEENGISPSTYYRKLRMMREDILSGEQQIVPIKPRVPHGIRITAGGISINMSTLLRKDIPISSETAIDLLHAFPGCPCSSPS